MMLFCEVFVFHQKESIINSLKTMRFAHINSEDILIKANEIDEWDSLKSSWNYLIKDNYMKNGDSYRKRAIGKFIYDIEKKIITILDDTKFYQKKEINSYAGGVERELPPMSDNIKSNVILHEVIKSSLHAFLEYKPMKNRYWNIYVHQFRIEAKDGFLGNPTPEGIHQDGHTFISMHMINRIDILGGVSKIYDKNKFSIKEVTLSKPLDSILLDDMEMFHSASPIEVKNNNYGFRDIMVIDYNEVENV